MLGVHFVSGAFAAPLAPAAGLGAGALITILAWLICFTLAYIWRRSFGAMLQWLADEIDRVRLPALAGGGHVFGAVSSAFRYVDSAVEGALVYAANATEHGAVWLFHETAARFDSIGRELGGLAFDVSRWGSHLIHATIPREIGVAQRILNRRIDVVRARLTTALWAEAHAWRAGVRRLEVEVAHDFGLARRGIDVTRREAVRAERDVVELTARIKALERTVAHVASPIFFVRGFDRLGLRWLRCPSLVNTGKKVGCLGFSLVEELLAATFTSLALSDICTFAAALTRLAEWYQPLLMELVDAEDALIGCHGASKPEPLGLPRLYLPPVPAPLPLG